MNRRSSADGIWPTIVQMVRSGVTVAAGPSQLALSLMADALGSNRAGDQLALGFYQDFKWRVINTLEQELPWEMTWERVLLQVRDLIRADLDFAASRVTDARARPKASDKRCPALLNIPRLALKKGFDGRFSAKA
jgi:hypothetical protein